MFFFQFFSKMGTCKSITFKWPLILGRPLLPEMVGQDCPKIMLLSGSCSFFFCGGGGGGGCDFHNS